METILIADDHAIVRGGISALIECISPKYHIREASSCAEVMQALTGRQVQYAVLDMNLADGNCFADMKAITAACCHHTRILVYSMNAERMYARPLLEKGVSGFVNKEASIAELEKAIRHLLNGATYLSPALKQEMARFSKVSLPGNPVDVLSGRELEVMEYLITGIGPKEIARRMNLDITTVSTYRRRAFEKLEVQNVVELKDKLLLYKIIGSYP